MPTAALLLSGGITTTQPYPTIEPFDLGSVAVVAEEPFDIIGPKAYALSVEEFWMLGGAVAVAVEPFDLGSKAALSVTEPFDILGADTPVFDPEDLGDGDVVSGTAEPVYGWWETVDDALEDLGPMATD